MLPGLDGLPAIAMMDPDAFADMQIGLHGMPMVLTWPGSRMTLTMRRKARLYTLNSPDMKLKMDDMQKQLKDLKVKPFDQEQMKKLNKQMKDLREELPQGQEFRGTGSAGCAGNSDGCRGCSAAPQTPQ